MDGKYDVLDVCKYVINYINRKGYVISNLKLQKILYFIQAYFLAFTTEQRPCFRNKIEAWDFGPVVPDAYHEYKQYGGSSIPIAISGNDSIIDEEDRKYMEEVIDQFSKYSATALVTITHNQEPWRSVYRKGERNIEITTDSIKDYFKDE